MKAHNLSETWLHLQKKIIIYILKYTKNTEDLHRDIKYANSNEIHKSNCDQNTFFCESRLSESSS